METLKGTTQAENQINYIPGHIVLNKDEANSYIVNGGVCAIIYNSHLDIYVNPLKKSSIDHDRLSQQTKKNAVVKITDDNIEELPPPIVQTDLLQAFTNNQTTEKLYYFHTFNFHNNMLIIIQTNNLTDNTIEYAGPIRIIKNSQRTDLHQL
jgi:hypothetical protein